MVITPGTAAAESVFAGVSGACVSVLDPLVEPRSTECSGGNGGGALRFVAGYRTASGQKCYFVDTDAKTAGECGYPLQVGIHAKGLLP